MRIMALDYGDVRTGVAISDERGILCGETQVLAERDAERLAKRVLELAESRGCASYCWASRSTWTGARARARKRPAPSPRCSRSPARRRSFCATSAAPASRRTASSEPTAKREKKHRQSVDAVAAQLILETYLGTADNARRQQNK